MFDWEQFCEAVVEPSLEEVGLYSRSAEQLLIGTACVESRLGTYLQQINGPALGVFQMEPATHNDIWENYLSYRSGLKETIRSMVAPNLWNDNLSRPKPHALIHDLRYATVMARLVYRRSPKKLPAENDWGEAAAMWKSVYNTHLGKGTEFKFLQSLKDCHVVRSI